MNKNVLIISTTMRKGGNSHVLAEEFARGAVAAGNNVEVVSLIDKTISFCKGCMACVSTNKCVINDDATKIMLKMRECDVVVFATPIYYYEMTGQMKTLIDRCNPNYSADYRFKDVYLIATAAERELSAMDGAIKGVQGFVDCYQNCELSGVIYGVGLTDVGEAQADTKVLQECFVMGKNV